MAEPQDDLHIDSSLWIGQLVWKDNTDLWHKRNNDDISQHSFSVSCTTNTFFDFESSGMTKSPKARDVSSPIVVILLESQCPEELVMVSFHVQLQGTLMYIGDIAITIQSELKDRLYRDGYETFVVVAGILPYPAIVKDSENTAKCKVIIMRPCTYLEWLLSGRRQHTRYSTALCYKGEFIQSPSWSVRDMNGLRQDVVLPKKTTIEDGRSTPAVE
ncbi:hypothetical protein F5888DRAFT_1634941 [Russula emetica]|nr:hypothetical protein F5888DRAFT_1634941 [Russula emetica]